MSRSSLSIAGTQADGAVLALLGLALGIFAFLVCRRWPRTALGGWLLIVCFAPIWVGLDLGFYVSLATLGAGLVLVACLPVLPSRIGLADWMIVVLFGASLAPVLLGATNLASAVVLPQWAAAFLLGRLIAYRVPLDTVCRLLAVVFAVAGALAIVEFLSGFNPIVSFVTAANPVFESVTSGSLFERWSPLQARGGIIRAEGAFGHSIALGACLALVIPIAVTARFSVGVRLLIVVALTGGAVVSFSRIGMICSVLAIVLSVLFLRRELTAKARAAIASVIVVAGIAVVPFITATFAQAGDEASSSAAYRGDLLSLIPGMVPFGLASSLRASPGGELYFGSFRSIDSAVILFGLTYGWIPLLVVVVLIVAAVVLTGMRRASPPMIAVVAQLPAVFSVALINQYAIFLWFMIGLAVYTRGAQSDDGAATPSTRVDATARRLGDTTPRPARTGYGRRADAGQLS